MEKKVAISVDESIISFGANRLIRLVESQRLEVARRLAINRSIQRSHFTPPAM